MDKQNTHTTNMTNVTEKTLATNDNQKRSANLFRQSMHCPFCGGSTKHYTTSYYCERCEVDLDADGNIIE